MTKRALFPLVTVLALSNAVLAAPSAPPAEASVIRKDGDNVVTINNRSSKPLESVCFTAVYKEGGEQRFFSRCDDVSLDPNDSTTITCCSEITLQQVEVTSAQLKGAKRWYRAGERAPKGAPPLVLTTTRLTFRDYESPCTSHCKPEAVFQVQNTSAKQIIGYDYDFRKDGQDYHGTVQLNDTLEPGEISYEHVDGASAHITSVLFADKSEWKAPTPK
jgi:hypothetical protein